MPSQSKSLVSISITSLEFDIYDWKKRSIVHTFKSTGRSKKSGCDIFLTCLLKVRLEIIINLNRNISVEVIPFPNFFRNSFAIFIAGSESSQKRLISPVTASTINLCIYDNNSSIRVFVKV